MLLSDTLKVTFPTDATNESDEDAEDVLYMVAMDEKVSAASKTGLILTNGKLNLKTIPSMRLPVIS